MANLDIAERRMPQDGRFSIKVEGKDVDVRVSCMPTIYGENVVLRLLNVASALLPLKDLGFAAGVLGKYEKLIIRPRSSSVEITDLSLDSDTVRSGGLGRC